MKDIRRLLYYVTSHEYDYEDAINWAVESLKSGMDTPSLRILAGLQRYEFHEVAHYLKQSLKELGHQTPSYSVAKAAYMMEVAESLLSHPKDFFSYLEKLHSLDGFEWDFSDFSSYYWGYCDLKEDRNTFYGIWSWRSFKKDLIKYTREWIREMNQKFPQLNTYQTIN